MVYAGRLARDYEVAIMADATRRDPDLKVSAAYVDWSVRNQDVVL